MRRFLSVLSLLAVFVGTGIAQIRVACVGNSITEGYSLKDPSVEAYPAVMQRLLGDDYLVMNFGLSGYTLMNKGNLPYMKSRIFQDALASNPDIVTIKLGTNDSKPYNWDNHKEDFVPSLNALIDSFLCLPSHPAIYICLPAPASGVNFDIVPEIVDNEICPLIVKVANERGLPVININEALRPYLETLEDKIHPNRLGAAIIAEEITRRIIVDAAKQLSK